MIRSLHPVATALALAGGLALAHGAAAASALKPQLAGLAFLVGDWGSGKGQVADTGGASTGASHFTVEANGAVMLRRDHTELFDRTGKPTGGFDQIMTIYAEGGVLRGDYADGDHVIHYATAELAPGHAVTFTSAAQPGAPTFRLSYTLSAPDTLAVAFSMAPPGATTFRPIATGVLARSR